MMGKKASFAFYRSLLTFSLLLTLFVIPAANGAEKKSKSYCYNLSICAIFQNEARFIREWIEFHRIVGVDHFYLFNHLSEDDYLSVLQPYIDNGIVSLYQCTKAAGPGIEGYKKVQCAVYDKGIAKTKGVSRWVAFLDLDEFLFPVMKWSLTELLDDYRKCKGLCVNWQMFGTSGVKRIPEGAAMVELLVKCAPKDYDYNLFVKSIVRPEYVSRALDSHRFLYQRTKGGKRYNAVNPDGKKVREMKSDYVAVDKVRINHYWMRDEDYLHQVKIPRRNKWEDGHWAWWQLNEILCREVNVAIIKYLPELNRRLFYEEDSIDAGTHRRIGRSGGYKALYRH